MGKLDGKVAVVTGGARGMGASHVRALVAEGAKVVFGDVLEDAGKLLEDELGQNCRFIPHDVTSAQAWSALVEGTLSTFGQWDVLVNNAGILSISSLEDMTVTEFREILDVNLVSQWLGIKHAATAMNEGGSIVNISSVNGLVGGARLTGYSASKFGVRGLTRSAALELGPKRIRVNSVHPAGVATPMVGRDEEDIETDTGPMTELAIPRYGKPSEVSQMVLYLAGDDSSYCTGSEFVIDGGMTAGGGF